MQARTLPGCLITSKPATSADPPSGDSKVVKMRTTVVLPAPFGPSRPSTVPSGTRSEEHTSELQSQSNLVCRLLLEKKKTHVKHIIDFLIPLALRQKIHTIPLSLRNHIIGTFSSF